MKDDDKRQPFHLFKTLGEELAADRTFWLSQAPEVRWQYLHHLRCVEFGEEAVNAPMVRCYGWRKLGEEPDPKNVVYF